MANHVHLVVQLPDSAGFSAGRMMQRLKGRTAVAANKLLGWGKLFGSTKATTM
jgi:putative transposase